MSIPKKEGGLGFKNLHDFNRALLAKQAWRILKNPSSLLARIYKGLYHHHHQFLQAKPRSNSSYGWRSVLQGKNLLTHGL